MRTEFKKIIDILDFFKDEETCKKLLEQTTLEREFSNLLGLVPRSSASALKSVSFVE